MNGPKVSPAVFTKPYFRCDKKDSRQRFVKQGRKVAARLEELGYEVRQSEKAWRMVTVTGFGMAVEWWPERGTWRIVGLNQNAGGNATELLAFLEGWKP